MEASISSSSPEQPLGKGIITPSDDSVPPHGTPELATDDESPESVEYVLGRTRPDRPREPIKDASPSPVDWQNIYATRIEPSSKITPEESKLVSRHFTSYSSYQQSLFSVREYFKLELAACEADGTAGDAHWILRHRTEPDLLIAGCTVRFREAAVNNGQGTTPTHCAIIKNLWTHFDHRMKGMARKLLEEVGRWLDSDQVKRRLFTEQLRIRITGKADFPIQDEHSPVTLLYEDLQQLSWRDSLFCTLRIGGVRRDNRPRIQVLPNYTIMKWHILRARQRANLFRPGHLPIQRNYGVKLELKERGAASAWMWWVHDFEERRLKVCRVAMERDTGCELELQHLLGVAIQEATRNELDEIIIWDPPNDMWHSALLIAQTERFGPYIQVHKEELPGVTAYIRWPEGMPTDGDWIDRQYYCCN